MTTPTEQALAGRVERAMKAFRERSAPTTLEAPAGVFFTPTRWRSRPYAQPMIWVATAGCRHVKDSGGCTMCDFGRGDFSQKEIDDELGRVLDRLGSAPLLHLFAPGSFLDDAEVPADFRDRMLAAVAARGAAAIGIEARPEHIDAETLVAIAGTLRQKTGRGLTELSVGTGVEAFDDAVARVCVNKGSTRAAAATALQAVRNADALVGDVAILAEAHVLLKPPALTEAEAIADATAAIAWCLGEGFERAVLMLCSAKPHTPLGVLAGTDVAVIPAARYQPASLWSALEVLAYLPASLRPKVRVHGFAGNTDLGLRPTSCPACEQVVVAAIQHFNFTGSEQGLEAVRGLGCRCREVWQEECEQAPPMSLETRMNGFVDALERAAAAGGS